MEYNVQCHAALLDVARNAGGTLSGMKGLVDLITVKMTNIANPK